MMEVRTSPAVTLSSVKPHIAMYDGWRKIHWVDQRIDDSFWSDIWQEEETPQSQHDCRSRGSKDQHDGQNGSVGFGEDEGR
jgi:hypothetical protein